MGMWSRSYYNHTGSNVNTTNNQGGGSKKAGFPYMVGKLASGLGHVDIYPLKKWNVSVMPLAHITRPIGSTNANRSYWNVK